MFLKKELYEYLKKQLIVTPGNALENLQLCTYFTENYWTTFSNTSGNVLKMVTNENGAKVS